MQTKFSDYFLASVLRASKTFFASILNEKFKISYMEKNPFKNYNDISTNLIRFLKKKMYVIILLILTKNLTRMLLFEWIMQSM